MIHVAEQTKRQESPTPKQTKLRFGQIGCGQIAWMRYLPAYKYSEHAELVAACDGNPTVLKRVRETFGLTETRADYRELLRLEQVQAVVITTPTPTHSAIAVAAAEAGKHIILEKPIALSLKEANAILDAVALANVKFVPLPFDQIKSLVATRRMLCEGRIGRIVTFDATASNGGVAHSEWFYRRGGGVLSDLAVYPISWMVGIAGPASQVAAISSTVVKERFMTDGSVVKSDVEDNVVVTLRWADGTLAAITSNSATEGLGTESILGELRGRPIFHMTVYGREGIVHIDNGGNPVAVSVGKPYPKNEEGHYQQFSGYSPDLGEYPESSRQTWNGPEILDHLAASVLFGEPLQTNAYQQRHVVEIIEKAYASIRSGQLQDLETSFELTE
jgi:predicted dehydrogenase